MTPRRVRRRVLERLRSAGFTTIPMVVEGAMVMAWFCAFIVGEQGVCKTVGARRSAETGAEESATAASAAYCQPKDAGGSATTIPSPFETPKLDVESAISAIAGLGLGGQRTFGYYTLPLQNVRVQGLKVETIRVRVGAGSTEQQFVGQRSLGCVEKPLDAPQGSLDEYRMKIWVTKLMGY